MTYKLEATGQVANHPVFRGDEATPEVVEQGTHRAFDTPEARFRLVMEATRIRMAYLFDPLLALSTSQVEAVPHQIGAVYETMLRRQPLCFLLAADTDAMETLTGETRRYLAWSSVQRDAAALNLNKAQVEQGAQAVGSGDKAVALQLENGYLWLLAPIQEEAVPPPNTPTQIEAVRLSSGNDLASLGTVLQRASYRAVTDNHLITRGGPKLLQLDLQRFTLWQGGDHLSVRQLWQYLATYLYLPRLRDKEVLLTTIRAGQPPPTSSATRWA